MNPSRQIMCVKGGGIITGNTAVFMLQILIVMGLLVTIMGWAATMAGFAVTVVMIPSSTLVGRYLQAARKEMLKHTDARVKLSTEIVTGIKAIKLYAWEDPYVERIGELRERELKQIRKTQLLTALNTAVFMVKDTAGIVTLIVTLRVISLSGFWLFEGYPEPNLPL